MNITHSNEEPTLLMKRNYKLPSYATLFQYNRHTPRNQLRTHSRHNLQLRKTALHHKMITNTSSYPLNVNEYSVLTRGLGFIPTPPDCNNDELSKDFESFVHKIYKQFYFRNEEPFNPHPFKQPSLWIPPPTDNPEIEQMINQTRGEIPNLPNNHRSHPPNLNKEEREALKRLTTNPSITIKQNDKGGGLCIMDTETYIAKMQLEHLDNTSNYKPLTYDPTKSIAREVRNVVQYLWVRHYIDETTTKFLLPHEPTRTPIIYGQPKIHKTGHPLRPIVSGCDGPTDNLSKYVTHFIQPLAERLPTYLKDSKQFLSFLDVIPPLPHNAILVTADVTSLYTNIPQGEGIQATMNSIRQNKESLPEYAPPPHVFHILLETILQHSTFRFGTNHYQQTQGTSMGTRMAPPYANIFMYDQEYKFLSEFNTFIKFWRRLIDDIFYIFIGSWEQLEAMQKYMNQQHPTIKYTFSASKSEIAFLDMVIYIDEDRRLRTKLYKKPTDCNALLHFHSHHPAHTKRSVIYSQAIRYNMLSFDDAQLQIDLYELTRTLLIRDYPLHLINGQISKALTFSQSDLIYKERNHNKGERVLPFVTTFTPKGQTLATNLQQTWPKNDEQTMNIWRRPPIKAFKRSKNFKDILVHSDL